MTEIWIVDDDTQIIDRIEKILAKENYLVKTFSQPEEIIGQLAITQPAIVISDIFFKNSSLTGDSIIAEISKTCLFTQSVVMSGESDVNKVLNCLKLGALDFLDKPVSLPRLLTTVKNAETIYNSRVSTEKQYSIMGNSKAIKNTVAKIKKLAMLNESVLILGESGTGKELAARNLHLFSNRYSKEMQMVNCTALNTNLIESELFGHLKGSFTGATNDKKGYFEIANKSTLFIDEIGDFPLELQVKLLRVLQEKKITPVGSSNSLDIDTKLIFATHQDLEKQITEKKIREDFFFRISTFSVKMPPLRERLEDIDVLANHFLQSFLSENNLKYKEFSESALSKLKEYNYPGNIRELIQIVKNGAFFSNGEKIEADDISFTRSNDDSDFWDITDKMELSAAKTYFEKILIERRLQQKSNDIEKTANSLGMIKNNLYRKLNNHNLK